MGTLRCREAFAVTDKDGAALVFAPGDLVDSKNKWVKGRENMFETVEANVERRARPVEEATAAPGEKRYRTQPQVHEARGEANPQEGDDGDDDKPAKKAAAKKSTAKKAESDK